MLNLSLVSAEHQIAAVGTELYAVACGLVESALPPVGKVAERVYQSEPMQFAGIKVDDGDLLSRPAGEGTYISARDKNAIIRVGTHISSGAHIVHE